VAGVMIFVHDDVFTSFTSIVVWHFGLGWPFRLLHLVLSAATVGVVLDWFQTVYASLITRRRRSARWRLTLPGA